MKNKFFIISIICFVLISSFTSFSATVIKKEDAALFSKKSIYSDIGVQEGGVSKEAGDSAREMSDEAANKFTCVTATKNGNTYTNNWSNYTIDIDSQFENANDDYDFYADGIKYDFGIVFYDYSRLAVYYTRLSRDLNVVCANFAPGQPVDEVTIAGEIFKHVSLDVPYPYGVEKYNYYLRNCDGKLMIIETYHEDGSEKSTEYIEKFEKLK